MFPCTVKEKKKKRNSFEEPRKEQHYYRKKINSTDKSEALQYLFSTELTQVNIESEAELIKSAKSSHCTSETLQTGKLK